MTWSRVGEYTPPEGGKTYWWLGFRWLSWWLWWSWWSVIISVMIIDMVPSSMTKVDDYILNVEPIFLSAGRRLTTTKGCTGALIVLYVCLPIAYFGYMYFLSSKVKNYWHCIICQIRWLNGQPVDPSVTWVNHHTSSSSSTLSSLILSLICNYNLFTRQYQQLHFHNHLLIHHDQDLHHPSLITGHGLRTNQTTWRRATVGQCVMTCE